MSCLSWDLLADLNRQTFAGSDVISLSLSMAHLTVCLYLVALKQRTRRVKALEGRRVDQKALRGSDIETRELQGGTAENSVSQQGVIGLLFRQTNDFYLSGSLIRI